MKQIPSPADHLVVYGDFPGFAPEDLYEYWVNPDLLKQWWPEVVENDLRVGGTYRFSWPAPNWFLQGTYGELDPGKRLRFSWTWNHEPGVFEPLWVDVFFMPIEGGTRLSIFHGLFSESESDQAARAGCMEGWIHFGQKLASLKAGA